jgi:nitroreductase
VPRDVIEKLLSAGAQAPNHHKTRPWRFVVLTGDGRKKLGDVMAASFLDRNPATPPEGLDKTRALPLRAPVVIAVGADKPTEPKIIEMENISAASAACSKYFACRACTGTRRDLAYWRMGTRCKGKRVFRLCGRPADRWFYLRRLSRCDA